MNITKRLNQNSNSAMVNASIKNKLKTSYSKGSLGLREYQ